MQKILLLILFTFLSSNIFSQMSLVSGQPEHSLMYEGHVKVNEDLGFAFYYTEEDTHAVYTVENGVVTEIVWEEIPWDFHPTYKGRLGNKYYFFSSFFNLDNGPLYEYDHSNGNTRKIAFPQDNTCDDLLLLSDSFNGKIYYDCRSSENLLYDILSFDGNNFEPFESYIGSRHRRGNSLFVDSMDKILLWYYDNEDDSGRRTFYTFDGTNLTHIPYPENDVLMIPQAVIFQDHVLVYYVEMVDNALSIYSLYKFDGSNLIEIPGLSASPYVDIHFFIKEDKIYILMENLTDNNSSFYEYDGNSLTEIFGDTSHFPHFVAELDGTDLFSLYDENLGHDSLYELNGTTMEEITGATSHAPIIFGGMLNDKIYLSYYDRPSRTKKLFSYSSTQNEVELFNGIPQDLSYGHFELKHLNSLIHKVTETGNYPYYHYAQNENETFFSLDPENHFEGLFRFQLGDKVYYSYLDSAGIGKLFVWDGTLSTPDFDQIQNDILVHPNPTLDIVYLEIPNTLTSKHAEITLYSMDGKLVKSHSVEKSNSQIQISLENLVSGIYILELKGETGVVRKKIVKK